MQTPLFIFVSVISLIAAVGSLITLAADWLNRPIKEWSPFPKAVVALTALTISVGTGIPAYQAVKTEPSHKAGASTPTATQPSGDPVPNSPRRASDTTISPERTIATTLPTSTAPAPTRPGPSARPIRAITDGNGAHYVDLELIGQRLRPDLAIIGSVEERSEYSAELQGLYTVHLTLTGSLQEGETTIDAFMLRSRGGGFQAEAARVQARERLAQALAERLTQQP